MKNNRLPTEIKPEDIDSSLMWKALWRLIRRETLLVFLLKVLLVAAGFVTLILLIVLLGTFSGNSNSRQKLVKNRFLGRYQK